MTLEDIQRWVTIMIKCVKSYSYWEKLEKLWSTTLLERRKRGDVIEILKIIYGISNYGRDFFNISLWSENLLSRQISKTKSTYQLDFFR